MKLSQLKQILDRLDHEHIDLEVQILYNPKFTTIGSSPMVDIKSVSAGFDWNNGKILIQPEIDLTNVEDRDEIIRKLQDRNSLLEYENRNFKKELTKFG